MGEVVLCVIGTVLRDRDRERARVCLGRSAIRDDTVVYGADGGGNMEDTEKIAQALYPQRNSTHFDTCLVEHNTRRNENGKVTR
jgi:hypothetical protein